MESLVINPEANLTTESRVTINGREAGLPIEPGQPGWTQGLLNAVDRAVYQEGLARSDGELSNNAVTSSSEVLYPAAGWSGRTPEGLGVWTYEDVVRLDKILKTFAKSQAEGAFEWLCRVPEELLRDNQSVEDNLTKYYGDYASALQAALGQMAGPLSFTIKMVENEATLEPVTDDPNGPATLTRWIVCRCHTNTEPTV